MTCDCGSNTFFKFGPYPLPGERIDSGLRLIYTCSKCGDQLRVYKASKMPKEVREIVMPLEKFHEV